MMGRYQNIFTCLAKTVIAFCFSPFFLFLYKKKYDVIGTRNGARGYDNGEILFNYLNSLGKNTYLIYRDVLDFNEQKILKKNAIKTIIHIIFADRVFVTHSESDLIDFWWRFLFFKKVIFIQHGVIGIKALPEYEKKKFYKYLASNAFETSVFLDRFKIPNEKILKCGLPRFDRYIKSSNYRDNKCLIMFTWRKYLSPESELKTERIFELVRRLKQINPKLEIYINKHDMDPLNLDNDINGVTILRAGELSDALLSCGILFTDYSSVAWDFLYQKKKICFYPYDFNSYDSKEGLYCNFENFFGYKIDSIDEIDEMFFENLQENNLINNTRFLLDFPFYYHFGENHSAMIDIETQA